MARLLLAMATPVHKTDVGQMQRWRHHMIALGLAEITTETKLFYCCFVSFSFILV